MKIIASNLTDYLITRQYVSAKKRAWCIYFIQKKLLNIISIIMFWIISIHNRLFIETLLFASAFLLLRKRTGGLHMNSPYLCIFFSSLLIYYIPYGIPLLIQRERIIPLILIISFYIIQKFAPLNHPGIHMTEKECVANNRAAIKCFFVVLSIFTLFLAVKKKIWSYYIVLGIICDVVFIILGKVLKQEVKI